MKKLILSFAALVAFAGAYAQDAEQKEPQPSQPSAELASMQLASELVQYGNKHKSALPLIDAMQIIVDTQTQPLTGDEGKEADENAEAKAGITVVNFSDVAAKAKEYADGDATLLAMVENLESQYGASNRGAVGGPKSTTEVVRAHATDRYNIRFTAGRLAEVAVIGDGDTDLDLYIYDSNGNLIASDADYTDTCYVSWTPRWTGNFVVKVVNRGSVANRYYIVTN